MKYILTILIIITVFIGCESNKKIISNSKIDSVETDTIRIANEELEYEIIILEQGFERYLSTQPNEDFYGISFLEGKNIFYTAEYNRRVRDINYSRDLYPQEINYNRTAHYGQEVNYLLYMYFQFFEQKYNQKLK
ncbi:hypothetical protein ULMS_18280 [Patiriisocius marinistellae]|uniref:Uncharacterized protein n=1 Tax=Patiriisocius marinistellae TaxID=2494560 RepID=A0A5J4FW45_9FLAO|nr:DUF6146 family protein [Patiriisocius marinistellae]GEQ86320.1 hypothetical protein ULMS_18280 [Patiriisocius marinistellae]